MRGNTRTREPRALRLWLCVLALLMAGEASAAHAAGARADAVWTRQVRPGGETWVYHFTVPAAPGGTETANAAGGEAIRPHAVGRRADAPPPSGEAAAAVDIEAESAYLNTAPGGEGDDVVTPAVGQTVYPHLDFAVSGASGDVTFSRRALLDAQTVCSFTNPTPNGAYFTWCDEGWVATVGSHTLRWDLDFDDQVAESNEGNNSASTNWSTAAVGQVDVVAERVFLNTATAAEGNDVTTPALGQTVYFHLDYSVVGSGGAVAVDRRALIDGETFCDFTGAPAPGAYFTWCTAGWVATAGPHTLRWELDYRNSIAETNENNNSASAMWTSTAAGDVDIIAERAYLNTMPAAAGDDVTAPSAGQTVYFHLDYSVDGSGGSVVVDRRALIDGETFCDFTGTPTPGGYFTWCLDGWTATAGAHTLRWDLDYNNTVTETNESNNSASIMWGGNGVCTGNCNGDGEVTVNELITMVNVALGASAVSACTAGDANADGEITVNEIVAGVNRALTGCV